jgi:hypothetical protein
LVRRAAVVAHQAVRFDLVRQVGTRASQQVGDAGSLRHRIENVDHHCVGERVQLLAWLFKACFIGECGMPIAGSLLPSSEGLGRKPGGFGKFRKGQGAGRQQAKEKRQQQIHGMWGLWVR